MLGAPKFQPALAPDGDRKLRRILVSQGASSELVFPREGENKNQWKQLIDSISHQVF